MRILHAIISNYIDTAEPVGSRTISKNFDLGLSPATIRNEMSDLEELGFIVQPHTSSGRIPSDKGYRFYVDILLQSHEAQMKKIALLEDLVLRTDRVESLLQEVGKTLAKETHYATIVSTPQYKRSKIKNIQLISIDQERLLAIVVTDSNVIKNFSIAISGAIEQNILNRLSYILNENLYGLSLEEINLPLIQNLRMYAKENEEIITKVLDVVAEAVKITDDADIYTSGTTNILKFPEFNDVNKAMELIDTLEEKDVLKNVLMPNECNDGEIQIRIGEEIEIENMKDCSIITASYCFGNNVVGSIGIIGPKRMDYAKTISSLKYLIENLEKKMFTEKKLE